MSFLGTGWQLEKVEGCDIITHKPFLCYMHPVSRGLYGTCELQHLVCCLLFKPFFMDSVQQVRLWKAEVCEV